MIYPIVKFGDAVLEKMTAPVKTFDEELQKLTADMFESMYASEGVGLAAPQIGLSLRLAVIDVVAPEDTNRQSWLERLEQARSGRMPTHIRTLPETRAALEAAGFHLLDCHIQERRRHLKDWLRLSATRPSSIPRLQTFFLQAAHDAHACLHLRRQDRDWVFYHTVARWLWRT